MSRSTIATAAVLTLLALVALGLALSIDWTRSTEPAPTAARERASREPPSREPPSTVREAGSAAVAPDAAARVARPRPDVRPSSFRRCGQCDANEDCDAVTYDMPDLEDLRPGSRLSRPALQSGDGLCHRRCSGEGSCAAGETCRSAVYYVSDTPARTHQLCFCTSDAGCAPVVPVAEGGLAMWREQPKLPFDVYYHAQASGDHRVVVAGGLSSTKGSSVLRDVHDVHVARVSDDGSVGPWMNAGALPASASTTHAAIVIARGRIYVSGGMVGGSGRPPTPSREVFSAPLAADGGLGAWRSEAKISGRQQHVMLALGSTMIVAGGTEDARFFTKGSSTIQLATIGDDGVLSTWSTLTTPMTPTAFGGAGIVAGRLVLGSEQQVYSTPIDPTNGGVGTWRSEPVPSWQNPQTHDAIQIAVVDVGPLALGVGGSLAWTGAGTAARFAPWVVASRPGGSARGYGLSADPESHVVVKTGGFGEGSVWTTRPSD